MLIQFRVGNYRSFREPETLSLVATRLAASDPAVDENNVFSISERARLLTSAAIYGANASGKSNLVRALSFVRELVLAPRASGQLMRDVHPFRFHPVTKTQPSSFEVVFQVDESRYRYGFEASSEQVRAEWLYDCTGRKEARLFTREGDALDLSRNFREGKRLSSQLRSDTLFLPVVAQFNGPIALRIVRWFADLTFWPTSDQLFLQVMGSSAKAIATKAALLRLLRAFDLGIEDLTVECLGESDLGPARLVNARKEISNEYAWQRHASAPRVTTYHQRFTSQGDPEGLAAFDLTEHESPSTRKLIELGLVAIDALAQGKILIVDDLSTGLHPLVTRAFLGMFNAQTTNPRHAQLIFTTHDTHLLSNQVLRRDQIWFMDKDRNGASHFVSLVEYRVRNNAPFEKDYLNGRYGGVPFIADAELDTPQTAREVTEGGASIT